MSIDIEDLTLRQINAIKNDLFGAGEKKQNQFIGKYVVCRCYSAGVHAGELVSQENDIVVLKNSRRLYYWIANEGIALSGVAQNGIKPTGCKIDVLNPEIMLTSVIEIIPTTKKAEESINEDK